MKRKPGSPKQRVTRRHGGGDRARFVVGSALLGLATLGCSEADTPTRDAPAADAWYALTSVRFDPEGSTGYVVGTARLAGATLDLADSVEIPGGGAVFSAGDGRVFVGTGATPLLTPYRVTSSGALTPESPVSFAPYGLSSTWFFPHQVHFLAPDRALVLGDRAVYVWDPTASALLRELPIPALDRNGFEPAIGYQALRDGERFTWTVQYTDFDAERVLPETVFVTFDATNETFITHSVSGCAEVTHGARLADGSQRWVTGAYGASIHALSAGARAPAPCSIRVASSGAVPERLDAPLTPELGNARVGDLTPVDGERALIRVLDDALAPPRATATAQELSFASAWRWYEITWTGGAGRFVSELAPSAANTLKFPLDGAAHVPLSNAEFSATELFAVDSAGARRALVAPGVIYSAVRAR
jgi:hypothetical protein